MSYESLKNKKIIDILAISGGGCFGVIPATLLADKPIDKDFEVVSGTSIGAAIAAWYAMGKLPSDLPKAMEEGLPAIFSRPWYSWHRMTTMGSKWPKDELIKWCTKNFNIRMGDTKIPVYIVALDFHKKRPRIFSSFSDPDMMLYTAVLCSVSAPTYFDPEGDYVDGGLFANTPSVVVSAEVCRDFDREMDKVSVFSVGTSAPNTKDVDMSESKFWGILKWASSIVSVMLEGCSDEGMAFIASQMPYHAYGRFNNVKLDPKWEMDDADGIPYYTEEAKKHKHEFDAVYWQYTLDTNAE